MRNSSIPQEGGSERICPGYLTFWLPPDLATSTFLPYTPTFLLPSLPPLPPSTPHRIAGQSDKKASQMACSLWCPSSSAWIRLADPSLPPSPSSLVDSCRFFPFPLPSSCPSLIIMAWPGQLVKRANQSVWFSMSNWLAQIRFDQWPFAARDRRGGQLTEREREIRYSGGCGSSEI